MCGPSQRHIEIEAQFQEDLTPRDRAVLGGAAVAAAAGGVAVMGASTGAAIAANPVGNAVLPVVAGAVPKLMTLADKFQARAGDIVNTAVTSGTRLLDTASGNINTIIPRLDGASGWIRVTLDPTMSRVISAGLQTANQVKNGLANGRFIPK